MPNNENDRISNADARRRALQLGQSWRMEVLKRYPNADVGLERSCLAARCDFMYDEENEESFCGIPYEDHNDEQLGHVFVVPEPDQRDY
jgi:hypothetical protein